MKTIARAALLAALIAGCHGGPTHPPHPRNPPVPTSNPCDGSAQDPRLRTFYMLQCSSVLGRLGLVPDIDRVNDAATFAAITTVDQICDILLKPELLNACDDAEAAFLTLLLNVAEGRLEECTCLKGPGPQTVADAIAVLDTTLANPGRTQLECAEALLLAGAINTRVALDDCSLATPTPTPSPSPSPTGSPTPSPSPTGSPTPTPTPPSPLPAVPAGCPTGGTVLTVAPGGSVASALASAKNGDIIVVEDGAYAGSVTIGVNKVTLVARNTGAATITGSVTMQFNNQCLVGMHVTGDVTSNHNNNTIADNTIDGSVRINQNNCAITGNKIGGDVVLAGNNNTLTGNTIGGSIQNSGNNNTTSPNP